MKKRVDKIIWYAIALVVTVVLIMVAFGNDIGLSPKNTRSTAKDALQKQDASTLIKNAVASQDADLIVAFVSGKASRLIDETSMHTTDPKISEAFSGERR